jgi:hypothetical protein
MPQEVIAHAGKVEAWWIEAALMARKVWLYEEFKIGWQALASFGLKWWWWVLGLDAGG